MDEPAVRGSIWGFHEIDCGHYVTGDWQPGDVCPFCFDVVETRDCHVNAVLRDVAER